MSSFSSPSKMFSANLKKFLKRAGITVLTASIILSSAVTMAKDETVSYSKALAVSVADINTNVIEQSAVDYIKVEYSDLQDVVSSAKAEAATARALARAEEKAIALAEAEAAEQEAAEQAAAVEYASGVAILETDEDRAALAEQNGTTQIAIEATDSSTGVSAILVEDDSYESGTYLGTYTATAYCGCSKCCGKSDGITASGVKATQGRTIAAPSTFAFGTELIIDGHTYVVEDRGGSISGNRIDIYFDSHADALAYGRKTVAVYVK